MTNSEIIQDLTSREVENIRRSGWYVITNSQNEEVIKPLVSYYAEIESKTQNLELGGGFAPNARFGEFALKVIGHYKENKDCSCSLFQSIGLDINPEEDYANVIILETIRIENKWVDYYFVECKKCTQKFQVFEREGHWKFYEWKKI